MKPINPKKLILSTLLLLFTVINIQAQTKEHTFSLSQPPSINVGFTVDTTQLPIIIVTDTTTGNIGKRYWVFDDGDYSNAVAPTHKYSKDGIYRVSLTTTDTTTKCQAKIEKEIKIKTTIVEPCRANYTFTTDTLNKTLTFTNTSSTEIDRNYWEFGDGTLSNAKSTTHTYNAFGYYKISLTVIDTNTICFDIKSINVNLFEKPKPCKADFTYNVDLTTQNIIFANHSEAPEKPSFVWNFADASTSTDVNPEHNYAKGGYYDVCLTLSDSIGTCRNTTCQNLKASDKPAFCRASFTYSVDTSTGNVNFYDNSKGNHNGWEWNYGDGTTEKNQNVKHKYTSGYYTVRLKITDSQTSCMSFNVAVINVKESQNIKAGFGYVKKEGVAKGVLPVEFKGASYGDATEVEWDFGDGSTNNSSIAPTHEYKTDGTYNACLKVYNAYTGESDSSCQQIEVVLVGIDKQTTNNSIKFYPNPVKQILTVAYNTTDEIYSIEIVNTLGQTVFEKNIEVANKSEQINISNLQNGIYFIKVKTKNGNIINKFIKE